MYVCDIFWWGIPCQKQTENSEFTTLHLCFPTIFSQGTLLVTCCHAPTVSQIYARGEIARTRNKQYLTSSVLFKKASMFTQLPWGSPLSSSWFWKSVSSCFHVSGPYTCPCSVDELPQPCSASHPSSTIPLALPGGVSFMRFLGTLPKI